MPTRRSAKLLVLSALAERDTATASAFALRAGLCVTVRSAKHDGYTGGWWSPLFPLTCDCLNASYVYGNIVAAVSLFFGINLNSIFFKVRIEIFMGLQLGSILLTLPHCGISMVFLMSSQSTQVCVTLSTGSS